MTYAMMMAKMARRKAADASPRANSPGFDDIGYVRDGDIGLVSTRGPSVVVAVANRAAGAAAARAVSTSSSPEYDEVGYVRDRDRGDGRGGMNDSFVEMRNGGSSTATATATKTTTKTVRGGRGRGRGQEGTVSEGLLS